MHGSSEIHKILLPVIIYSQSFHWPYASRFSQELGKFRKMLYLHFHYISVISSGNGGGGSRDPGFPFVASTSLRRFSFHITYEKSPFVWKICFPGKGIWKWNILAKNCRNNLLPVKTIKIAGKRTGASALFPEALMQAIPLAGNANADARAKVWIVTPPNPLRRIRFSQYKQSSCS